MTYQELRDKQKKLIVQRYKLDDEVNKLDQQLKVLPEYTFNFLDCDFISKENTPYIYNLLLKITMIENDDRSLEWGRGKNIVNYSGVSFVYDNVKYTTGYASNWCTGQYLYIEYDRAERCYNEIKNEDVEILDILMDNNSHEAFEKYLKDNFETELEQIAMIIFVTQNLMQW